MKKYLILIFTFLFIVTLAGCTTNNKYAQEFKEDYESLNGTTNKGGKAHRVITVDANNPYEEITASELVNRIENGDTFYVYFGSKLCPWCRSVIEKSIEVANSKGIKKIYYVDIWDDEGAEILRDKYEVQNGELVKTISGAPEYSKFLEYFDSVLSDYSVSDSEGNKISTGEKRIYAPNYIYVENGKAVRLITGISSLQSDSREELTAEMLKEEEELFVGFFK